MTRFLPFRGLISAGLLALLAGCAGSGPKPAPLVDFEPAIQARVAWRASVDKAGRYRFAPAIRDGAVYAAGSGGELLRLDAERGRVVWRVETGTDVSGGVGLGPNMVLLGTADGEVLAYDTDGKPLWRSRVSSEVLSVPAASASMVVVRSGDGRIFGLDPKDGARKWEYQATMPPLVLRSSPGLVVVNDDAVVAGLPGGKLVVLGIPNGALLWETSVATPRGDNELERIADVAGTPLVEPERVCAVTFQGRIGCYETAKGTQLWGRAASSAAGLGADKTTVYYTSDTGSVAALDKSTGASVWNQDKLFQRKVSAPLAFQSWVVVGDYEGYVHFLSRDDGAFVARVSTDGGEILAQPAILGDKVLVQTSRGGLFAIAVSDRKK
jgi:outer membrane protein assembly factor BamB